MEFRDEYKPMAVSPKIVVSMVMDAYQFLTQNRIDETYQNMALDLIRRYISKEGKPRDADPFFGAALYMVTRHPWSHPNPLTKTEFASKLRMKESSLEWYTDSISEKLGFIVLHDRNQLPFFVDPQGTIAGVIDSVVKGSVGEGVVRSIVSGNAISPQILADKIVDRLCNVVSIIPSAFEHELHVIVTSMIERESKKLLDQLSGH